MECVARRLDHAGVMTGDALHRSTQPSRLVCLLPSPHCRHAPSVFFLYVSSLAPFSFRTAKNPSNPRPHLRLSVFAISPVLYAAAPARPRGPESVARHGVPSDPDGLKILVSNRSGDSGVETGERMVIWTPGMRFDCESWAGADGLERTRAGLTVAGLYRILFASERPQSAHGPPEKRDWAGSTTHK